MAQLVLRARHEVMSAENIPVLSGLLVQNLKRYWGPQQLGVIFGRVMNSTH